MKTTLIILSAATIFCLGSCKKSDTTPDPVSIPPRPDTLSAGWKKITLDTTNLFADIYFANNTTGYLAGSKTYKTTDGGLTWNVISNLQFANIAVTNDGKVFFAGNGSAVYKSTDGGATLINTNVPTTQGYDIFFADNLNGYFVSSSGLFNTTDGGITWNAVNPPSLHIGTGYTSLFFTAANTGIVVGQGGVYKVNGSLQTWTTPGTFTPAGSSYFYSASITPNNNIYIVNPSAQVYKSTDNGISFSLIKEITYLDGYVYNDIHFVDNNTGYISAGKRIYKTTDAGATWNVVVALGERNIGEIHFTDAGHGWACGSGGTVLVFN